MSVQIIQQYHSKVERIIRYGCSRKDTAVRTIHPYEACYTEPFYITNSWALRLGTLEINHTAEM